MGADRVYLAQSPVWLYPVKSMIALWTRALLTAMGRGTESGIRAVSVRSRETG